MYARNVTSISYLNRFCRVSLVSSVLESDINFNRRILTTYLFCDSFCFIFVLYLFHVDFSLNTKEMLRYMSCVLFTSINFCLELLFENRKCY